MLRHARQDARQCVGVDATARFSGCSEYDSGHRAETRLKSGPRHATDGKPTKTAQLVQAGRLKLAPGQPNPSSKLTDAVQEKICGLITNGLAYEQACQESDISRTTFWNWRVWGTANPKGRYGLFFAAIKKALSAKKRAAVAEAERRIYARHLRRFL
jgi:hypothetical protein